MPLGLVPRKVLTWDSRALGCKASPWCPSHPSDHELSMQEKTPSDSETKPSQDARFPQVVPAVFLVEGDAYLLNNMNVIVLHGANLRSIRIVFNEDPWFLFGDEAVLRVYDHSRCRRRKRHSHSSQTPSGAAFGSMHTTSCCEWWIHKGLPVCLVKN